MQGQAIPRFMNFFDAVGVKGKRVGIDWRSERENILF